MVCGLGESDMLMMQCFDVSVEVSSGHRMRSWYSLNQIVSTEVTPEISALFNDKDYVRCPRMTPSRCGSSAWLKIVASEIDQQDWKPNHARPSPTHRIVSRSCHEEVSAQVRRPTVVSKRREYVAVNAVRV